MIRVAIIGDGYTAADLVRILAVHRHTDLVAITSAEHVGRRFSELYPHLTGIADLVMEATDINRLRQIADAVFLALPHGMSVPLVAELVKSGIKCVDLGADFRLKDQMVYESHYHVTHERPDLLREAVYGLPELHRDDIKTASIIANPGCYPTGAILALFPLLRNQLISPRGIVVDSKSGVSGAGRSMVLTSHFCEVNEGVKPYGVGTHRHAPEIEQELSGAAGSEVKIAFTPHLIPQSRGILTTAYAQLHEDTRPEDVAAAYQEAYAGERFVNLLPAGVYPNTKWVYGSNYVLLGYYINQDAKQIIVMTAIDNLTKGASGQAVQNLNLMFGQDEDEALKGPGVFP
jgi:N-acetyl-gamma-glutamyl-phosphate reductase